MTLAIEQLHVDTTRWREFQSLCQLLCICLCNRDVVYQALAMEPSLASTLVKALNYIDQVRLRHVYNNAVSFSSSFYHIFYPLSPPSPPSPNYPAASFAATSFTSYSPPPTLPLPPFPSFSSSLSSVSKLWLLMINKCSFHWKKNETPRYWYVYIILTSSAKN